MLTNDNENFSQLSNRTPKLTLASPCKDACEVQMNIILQELQRKTPTSPEQASLKNGSIQPCITQNSGQRAGLIITGTTLEFVLQESLQRQFLELTAWSHAVVCCRATPLQKSQVVKLVRNHLQVMTLAIGESSGVGPSPASPFHTPEADLSVCLFFCLQLCLPSSQTFVFPFPLFSSLI